MKKIFYLIVILLFSITLYGCPPKEDINPRLSEIENKTFGEGKLHITTYSVYQEENDVVVFYVEQENSFLKNLYLKGKSLEILSAKAFGYQLDTEIVDEEEYFVLDLEEMEVDDYPLFFLELTFAKNSVFKNSYFEEIVNQEIVAHSIDIYYNYDKTNMTKEFDNLRFFFLAPQETEYDLSRKLVVYIHIDDLLSNSCYKELYLPTVNQQLMDLAKHIVYYPNYENVVFIEGLADSFQLSIRRSNSGTAYGNQPKTNYEYNGRLYTIIAHENYQTTDYNIDFVINDEELGKIQYSYHILNSNMESIKAFIHTINEYKLNEN